LSQIVYFACVVNAVHVGHEWNICNPH
jgi:hypothetical protein